MAVIYQILNKISGKRYIGETKEKDPMTRWRQHKNNIKKGRGCPAQTCKSGRAIRQCKVATMSPLCMSDPALQDAVRRYGIENFEFKIILFCFDEDRFIYEKDYIRKYNTMTPNGYNITPGGEGGGFYGKKHTQESKDKIKESYKVYLSDPEYMKRWKIAQQEGMKNVDISSCMKKSEAFQKAVKEGRVGTVAHKKTKTEEELLVIRQKISNSVKYFENNGGHVVNIQKHREAMAKAKGIPIAQYDLSGNLVNTYNSINECSRKINYSDYLIRNAVNKKKILNGFLWKLADVV